MDALVGDGGGFVGCAGDVGGYAAGKWCGWKK